MLFIQTIPNKKLMIHLAGDFPPHIQQISAV